MKPLALSTKTELERVERPALQPLSVCGMNARAIRASALTLLAAGLLLATPVWGAVILSGESPGLIIPDASAAGLARTLSVIAPGQSVLDVNLALTLAGAPVGWNGDLYAWLRHKSGALSVLLNRPGRTMANPVGYADNGLLNVTFDDAAAADIHLYQQTWAGSPGPLGGVWQPDARLADPAFVADGTLRTAFLDVFSVFNGDSADGEWTLFLAVLSGGGPLRLEQWGLEINTAVIPESAAFAGITVLGLIGLAGAQIVRRRQHQLELDQPSQPTAR